MWVLTVEVVVLAVTGVALYFLYRPDAARAWTDAYGIGSSLGREARVAHLLTALHRWVAWLALPTALATAVLLAVRSRATERVAGGVIIGTGLVVVVLAAQVTGFALPWDQLGLWAVTVGTNITGYDVLRGDDVRFALIGGTEVAPSTLLKWLVVHVGLGVVVAGLTALGWRRARSPEPATTPGTDPVDAPVSV